MTRTAVVRRGAYHDSVTLMLASRDAEQTEGVTFAAAVMATPLNLSLLSTRGFELSDDLGPDDLVVAIEAEDETSASQAARAVEDRLAGKGSEAGVATGPLPPRSFRSAARRDPEANLAFIAVPGRNAAFEAAAALEAGLNVFCFSDGVDVEAEAVFKRSAVQRGLLFMGADCGTAIVDGVALGFANIVRRGLVGIVAASGTGLQEVTCLLDAAGVGISQAVGVGGRDLSAAVGGTMTLHALERLGRDDATEVIVVISKPPAPGVAARVAAAARATGRPAVVAFLGGAGERAEGVETASSLEEAADVAALLAGGSLDLASPAAPEGRPGHIRGLYSGGSLCYEAMTIVSAAVGRVSSNVPLQDAWRLDGEWQGHVFVDFGEDEYTEGRAHPMIDPGLRNEALARELAHPEVGAVLLDVVLGHGAHPDPAADVALIVAGAGTRAAVVASVCGTEADPQVLSRQIETLEGAGVTVTRSAATAARLALTASGADE